MTPLYTQSRFPQPDEKPADIGNVVVQDVLFHRHSTHGHLPDMATNKANRLTAVVMVIARLLTPEQQDQLASEMGWFRAEPEEEIVMNLEELMS